MFYYLIRSQGNYLQPDACWRQAAGNFVSTLDCYSSLIQILSVNVAGEDVGFDRVVDAPRRLGAQKVSTACVEIQNIVCYLLLQHCSLPLSPSLEPLLVKS